MKKKLVMLVAVSVVMVMGSAVSAEIINTYNGPITVTPGTVAYGEVGTLVNTTQMGNFGIGGTYHAPSFPAETAAVQTAGSTLDHYWVQNGSANIRWSLNTAVNAVLAFPGTDHGPLPWENLEYKMYGSNDQTNWFVGNLTAIYHDGLDSTHQALQDWYATRWDFANSYKYFETFGTVGVVFDDAGAAWDGGHDPEMDGIAAVPVPGAMLLGAIGLSVAGWRLRRKTT